jgi:hypothetical protein
MPIVFHAASPENFISPRAVLEMREMLETLNISLGGLRRIESPAGCEVIVNCLYHSRRLPVFGRLRNGCGIIEGCDGCRPGRRKLI